MAARMLCLATDAEFALILPDDFLQMVFHLVAIDFPKTQRRRRHLVEMLNSEGIRRAERSSHQILADRTARARLLLEMGAAA